MSRISLIGLLVLIVALTSSAAQADAWVRHTIDANSKGADGARLADIDGDGHPDIVTGWEEGGIVRVYHHPGPVAVRDPWPAVTVGRVNSPEDAVLVDVDGGKRLDVISCCEGKTQAIHVHWAPDSSDMLWVADRWVTQRVVAADGQMWMFCLPLERDARGHLNLIVGSKGRGATISRLTIPPRERDTARWTLQPLVEAGWIMSLVGTDMDGDGDPDMLYTDRKGSHRGCHWLENPGEKNQQDGAWKSHDIGGLDREVMFLDQGDLDGHAPPEIAVATSDGGVLVFQQSSPGDEWTMREVAMPDNTGTGKSVRIADVDLDGTADLVVSCENAKGRRGVFWLSSNASTVDKDWVVHDVSGTEDGVKFDLLQMVDLDGDGDLDVVTCEERDNLGVIWYENNARTP